MGVVAIPFPSSTLLLEFQGARVSIDLSIKLSELEMVHFRDVFAVNEPGHFQNLFTSSVAFGLVQTSDFCFKLIYPLLSQRITRMATTQAVTTKESTNASQTAFQPDAKSGHYGS
jgi:hypothetical protein